MNVLILVEGAADSFVTEVAAAISGYEPVDGSIDLRTVSDRAALVSALDNLSDVWDGLLLTPAPDPGNAALAPLTAELDCFSVEVQPDNIAARQVPTAGTDAQLFGLGVQGYALALELVLQRGAR